VIALHEDCNAGSWIVMLTSRPYFARHHQRLYRRYPNIDPTCLLYHLSSSSSNTCLPSHLITVSPLPTKCTVACLLMILTAVLRRRCLMRSTSRLLDSAPPSRADIVGGARYVLKLIPRDFPTSYSPLFPHRFAVQVSKTPRMVVARTASASLRNASSPQSQRKHKRLSPRTRSIVELVSPHSSCTARTVSRFHRQVPTSQIHTRGKVTRCQAPPAPDIPRRHRSILRHPPMTIQQQQAESDRRTSHTHQLCLLQIQASMPSFLEDRSPTTATSIPIRPPTPPPPSHRLPRARRITQRSSRRKPSPTMAIKSKTGEDPLAEPRHIPTSTPVPLPLRTHK